MTLLNFSLYSDSQEDLANKLHRRTSYLMATARDRTNAVPIEQAFRGEPQNNSQVLLEHRNLK